MHSIRRNQLSPTFISFISIIALCSSSPVFSNTKVSGADLWKEYGANPENHPQIPNCSFAGYHRGEIALPNVKTVVSIADFGGSGDGITDNSKAFREAIEAAWLAGGGAIKIPAGSYMVDEIIFLHRSGVVLRGDGPGKTVIEFKNPLRTALLNKESGSGTSEWNWSGGLIWVAPRSQMNIKSSTETPNFWKPVTDNPWPATSQNSGWYWEFWRPDKKLTAISGEYPRGTRTITVEDGSLLRRGDLVLMLYKNNADSSLLRDIAQHELYKGYAFGPWLTNVGGYNPDFQWPVQISAVEGDRITLAQPLRVAIKDQWDVALYSMPETVTEIGIEDLTVQLHESPTLEHNRSDGWNGICFGKTYNGWVKNVEIVDGNIGVMLQAAKNISVINTVIKGASVVHHPYAARTQTHDCLIDGFAIKQANTVEHGINTEALSTGNVWSRGEMNRGTFDTHRGMPFDFIRTDIRVENDSGSWPGGVSDGGPYMGRRGVHWNISAKGTNRSDKGLYIFQPDNHTFGALVGIQGVPLSMTPSWAQPHGGKSVVVADSGVVPDPPNLYLAQLSLRRTMQSWCAISSPSISDIPPPGNVYLRAEANGKDGQSVSAVVFEVAGKEISRITQPPFEYNWPNVASGTYAVVAKAMSGSSVIASDTRTITVGRRLRLSESDTMIHYSSGWKDLDDAWMNGGKARNNTANGAWFEVTFKGTRFQWITRRHRTTQMVDVFLDGIRVDTNLAISAAQAYYQEIQWDSGELPDRTHTVRIVKTGNAEILVDYADIVSTGAAGPAIAIKEMQGRGIQPHAAQMGQIEITLYSIKGVKLYSYTMATTDLTPKIVIPNSVPEGLYLCKAAKDRTPVLSKKVLIAR